MDFCILTKKYKNLSVKIRERYPKEGGERMACSDQLQSSLLLFPP